MTMRLEELDMGITDPSAHRSGGYRRYGILAAAVVMQMCLGATYSWSVFTGSIRELTGLGQGPVQLPFNLFYTIFPATMLISGTLLLRLGPRFCAMMGGVLFGGGWIVASFGAGHFWLTTAGIGLLGGVGVGFAYLVPVAAGVQWFPNHKGLVTGIALAGFGGGAAMVSQIAGRLMAHQDLTAFQLFRVFGLCFAVLVLLAGTIVRFPAAASVQKPKPLPFGRVVRHPRFQLLYLTMVTGLVAGFTVNANMTKLYAGPDLGAGVRAVAFFALANAAGRIIWGLFFDRVRTWVAVVANLILQGLLLLAAYWLLRSSFGLTVFALLAGFNYGGLLVIHASSSARIWGGEHVGQVYGWLSSSNIPASFAPLAAGLLYDRWGTFEPSLLAMGAALVFVALVVRKRLASAPD